MSDRAVSFDQGRADRLRPERDAETYARHIRSLTSVAIDSMRAIGKPVSPWVDRPISMHESQLIMTRVAAARSGNGAPTWTLLRCRSAGSKLDRIGGAVSGAALLLGLFVPSQTQTAVANGDTRTLNLYHSHTGESISATFRVNGVYDTAVLEKLNWFLRDWRNNDTTRMDPRLFDVVWEVYRTAGATQPIVIFSAYRSPETNAMLRRRSSGVAEYSQHMVGKAMDTTMPGMSMQRIREIGMQLQRGGVGYYPGSNFVHLDVGNVRSWPRMSYDQLARLFPDGKSVHLASNGQALPRYEEARAELAARGSVAVAMASPNPNGFFSWLFGGGRDAAEDTEAARPVVSRHGRTQTAALARSGATRSPTDTPDNGNRTTQDSRGEPTVAVASLDQRFVAEAPAQPTKTLLATFVPTPVARPSFEPAAKAEADAGADRPARQGPVATAAPLPPPRPQDHVVIARVFADVPEPPRRPGKEVRLASLVDRPGVELGATTAGSAPSDVTPGGIPKNAVMEPISRAATLPVVITRGSDDQGKVPSQVLAYAATAGFAELRSDAPRAVSRKPVPAPQTPTVPGRLDRSAFRSLTGGVATASLVNQSLLGPSVTGLRQAARVNSDILSPAPSIGYVATFGNRDGDLDTSAFTGSATKPLAAAPGLVRIMESELRYADHVGESRPPL